MKQFYFYYHLQKEALSGFYIERTFLILSHYLKTVGQWEVSKHLDCVKSRWEKKNRIYLCQSKRTVEATSKFQNPNK